MTRHVDHVLFELYRSAYLPLSAAPREILPGEEPEWRVTSPSKPRVSGRLAVGVLGGLALTLLLSGIPSGFIP